MPQKRTLRFGAITSGSVFPTAAAISARVGRRWIGILFFFPIAVACTSVIWKYINYWTKETHRDDGSVAHCSWKPAGGGQRRSSLHRRRTASARLDRKSTR